MLNIQRFVTTLALCCFAGSALAGAPQTTPIGVKKPTKMGAATKSLKTASARNPKTGRFVKKTALPMRPTMSHKPVTGRYMKVPAAASKQGTKTTPKRDPKTGRFIK